MRTYNNTIGNKIIDIVYEHESHGIGRNKLVRISGFAKNTIDRWLSYLRKLGIIKETPEYPLHLTELSIQKYRKNSLLLPPDVRRKNTIKVEKNIWSEKDEKSIILILSLMALGVYKIRKYHKPKPGLIEIHNPSNPQQFFMYGGKTIHSVSLKDVISKISTKNPDSPNKKAFLPNTKINYGNSELFGYVNLTIEEAQRIFDKLLDHNPPIIKPLKIKYKTQSEIRYIIADDLLKEFITNCILSFNLCVNDRLEYAYVYDLFYNLKIKDQSYLLTKGEQSKQLGVNDRLEYAYVYDPFLNLKIKDQSYLLTKGEQSKKYEEYMKIWYGTRRRTRGFFSMMVKRKEELNIKNNEKCELTMHYKKVIDERDKIIKDRHLFDNKFENVNEKYTPLLEKYGFIVNIFLELLFPQFIREIWKNKN